MKKAIIKSLIYILIFTSFTITLLVFGFKLRSTTIIKSIKNASTIIIGDSHTKYALNPALFDNAINLANNAETYQMSYLKLKKNLQYNKNVSNIIMGFSYHNFSGWFNDSSSKQYNDRLLNQLLLSDYQLLLEYNKSTNSNIIIDLTNNINNIFTYPLYYITNYDLSGNNALNIWGGYAESEFNKLSDEVSNAKIELYYYKMPNTFLQTQYYYLNKIIKLCKERSINVYLLNTPLNEKHKKLIPNKYIEQFIALQKEIDSDVRYINLENYKLKNDFFLDSDHLNTKGANLFSIYISALLNQYSN